jgi:hydrogenase-4 component F
MIAGLVVLVPFLAAVALACVARWRIAVWINAAASSLVFVLAGLLAAQRGTTAPLLRVDALAVHLVLLTGLVATAAGWFGVAHVPDLLAARRLDRRRLRWAHALAQAQLCGTLLALLANPPFLVWLGLAAASLAAIAGTGLAHGRPAMLAARRALLLGGISLQLALLGVVLATDAAPGGLAPVGLVPAFLLLGYAGLGGLAPLFVWTQALAAAPMLTAAQLGPLAAASLAALLRLRLASAGLDLQAWLLVSLGLATPLLAALGPRPTNRRSAVALAGAAQCGVAAVAFGVGSASAVTAGLFHLTLLVIALAALLLTDNAAGRPAALTRTAALASLAALPPFGLFTSAYLVSVAVVGRTPWLALPLGVGLLLNARLMLGHMVAAPRSGAARSPLLPLLPAWLLLTLVLGLGLFPAPVLPWFAVMAGSR